MLEESIARRVNAQSAIEQYTKKLDAHKAKVAEMQRQVDDLTPELNVRPYLLPLSLNTDGFPVLDSFAPSKPLASALVPKWRRSARPPS